MLTAGEKSATKTISVVSGADAVTATIVQYNSTAATGGNGALVRVGLTNSAGAAASLGSPNAQAMTKDPFKTEKSDKVGVTRNANGTYTSIARTDGPTKEIAKDLAIGKAKVQIASALNLEAPEFEFDVVDIKYEKGKGNIICVVQIIAKIVK
jgi:hypothetical protein